MIQKKEKKGRNATMGIVPVVTVAVILSFSFTSAIHLNQLQFFGVATAKTYEGIGDKRATAMDEYLSRTLLPSSGSSSEVQQTSAPPSSEIATQQRASPSSENIETVKSTSTSPSLVAEAPSTLSQGGDFTTQSALSFTAARQTNNIVNTNAYYDIIFVTSTTAAIAEIRVTFPAGTDVSLARLVEVEGIGNSLNDKLAIGPPSISGQTVRYVLNSADVTTIPAGTQIRLELSNIVNPPNAATDLRVTVETRNAANVIIDGPSQSFAYPIKQVGNPDIANSAITTNKIANGAVAAGKVSPSFMQSKILTDGENGWNPDVLILPTSFTITDTAVQESNSHVYMNLDETTAQNVVCMVEDIRNGEFDVACDLPPGEGSKLRYTIINQP